QQPIHARSCGYGNRERRHIDPPPILQLYEVADDGDRKKTIENPYISHFIVHCELYDAKTEQSKSLLISPSSHSFKDMDRQESKIQILIGTLSINGQELLDLQQEKGVFFIFADLSIRIEGEFRLQFRLTDLSSFDPFTSSTIIKDTVYSNPFQVYSPKTFPGIKESTELSRYFALQRMKIPVRITSKETKKGGKGEEIENQQQQQQHSTIPYKRIEISSMIHHSAPSSPFS
ncbi:velvet factor-domain-containing protein, partial [Cunninghamella echinulata]